MAASDRFDRRRLARELTRVGRASVDESLADADTVAAAGAVRIGVTGPPGAGKSTLIARLAETRLNHRSRIGVLAIDPTSPLSGGSILGDRIRMDEITSNPNLYIRSMPSRHAHDGLADNVTEMLAVMDRYGFDDVILETVGSGQADYTIRTLADTVVLVVVPESGDAVQTMKAGVMEMADIYVVNKADRPGAERMAADIRSVLSFKQSSPDDWQPPVLLTSSQDGDQTALDKAIEAHLEWYRGAADIAAQRRARARYHIESLINRRVDELLADAAPESFDQPVREIYRHLVEQLRLAEI